MYNNLYNTLDNNIFLCLFLFYISFLRVITIERHRHKIILGNLLYELLHVSQVSNINFVYLRIHPLEQIEEMPNAVLALYSSLSSDPITGQYLQVVYD